jgi:hypothetical protein
MTPNLTPEQIATLSISEIDRMSSDVYLSNLRANPTAFAARVDELSAIAAQKYPRPQKA